MSLSIFEEFVVVDLETTGLNPKTDQIIEVGAVRFKGHEVLETYSSLVNPYRLLPEFIRGLTGISQDDVDHAPGFGEVAEQLESFISASPVVGHNVSFDLSFLVSQGCHIMGPTFDTRELAAIFSPGDNQSLQNLALTLGIPQPTRHRALADAQVTGAVLLKLVQRGMDLDRGVLSELLRIAGSANWSLRWVFESMCKAKDGELSQEGARPNLQSLDLDALQKRSMARQNVTQPDAEALEFSGELVSGLLSHGGPVSAVLDHYEPRPQQEEMLKAVVKAFEEKRHLIVEAGTGVGKSLAYLLPSAMLALGSHRRVVISTNTINLQEQLINKDLPAVVEVLKNSGYAGTGGLRFTALKGRSNYLCLDRWNRSRSNETLPVDEARFLGKLLVWLQNTETGDRTELNLVGGEFALWERLSSQGNSACPMRDTPCFLRFARELGEAAQIVVVNHALLLSDLQREGGILPPYDYLVIDEAHHLEDEATRQLGFQISSRAVRETLEAFVGPRGIGAEVIASYRTSRASQSRKRSTEIATRMLVQEVEQARDSIDSLFSGMTTFFSSRTEGMGDGTNSLLVTSEARDEADWAALQILGENARRSLAGVVNRMGGVQNSLDGLQGFGLLGYEVVRGEIKSREESINLVLGHLDRFFLQPVHEEVYWLEKQESGELLGKSAPLRVDSFLRETLFEKKDSVIVTSATLSVSGKFDSIRNRLGIDRPNELLVDSPFDYPNSALICVPTDMPEPTQKEYLGELARTVVELAKSTRGRMLVLFTAYSALRAVSSLTRNALSGTDIRVLAQGVDGSPSRILREFLDRPDTVLFGTSSFWEGVDLPGDVLQILIVTRLPFGVPNDPVFISRSQLYEQPFLEYAVPEAVLRFRQGFGRLIRTKEDRGVVVVLDRRIISRPYGGVFLRSLPECTILQPSLKQLTGEVSRWLGT